MILNLSLEDVQCNASEPLEDAAGTRDLTSCDVIERLLEELETGWTTAAGMSDGESCSNTLRILPTCTVRGLLCTQAGDGIGQDVNSLITKAQNESTAGLHTSNTTTYQLCRTSNPLTRTIQMISSRASWPSLEPRRMSLLRRLASLSTRSRTSLELRPSSRLHSIRKPIK